MKVELPRLFVIDSKDAWRNRQELYGYAHTDQELILESSGFKAALARKDIDVRALTEGRFCLVYSDDNSLLAKTDGMAQETIFYYVVDGYWALSNSMLALVERVRKRGYTLKAYPPSAIAMTIANQSMWGGQPLSFNTMVEGVRILPADNCICITWRENGFDFQIQEAQCETLDGDYPELLCDYISNFFSLAHALVEAGYSFRVDVSGGKDTRLTFGLMANASLDQEKVEYWTDVSKPADLPIAETLRRMYGIGAWSAIRRRTPCSVADAFRAWQLGCAGVYSPLYFPKSTSSASELKVSGANFADPVYRPDSPVKRAKILGRKCPDPVLAMVVEREMLSAFDNSKLNLADRFSMDWHYTNFRSRFHYGRNWYKSLNAPLVSPLVSKKLSNITRLLPPDTYDRGQLRADIMAILDQRLLEVPFDSPEKSFDTEIVQRSRSLVSRLGLGRHDLLEKGSALSVYGEPLLENKAGAKEHFDNKEFLDLMSAELHRAETVSVLKLFGVPDEIYERGKKQMQSRSLGKEKSAAAFCVLTAELGKHVQ